MAEKIIWSQRALNEFNSILEYWEEKNQSNMYSKKLAKQIIKSIEKLVNLISLVKKLKMIKHGFYYQVIIPYFMKFLKMKFIYYASGIIVVILIL